MNHTHSHFCPFTRLTAFILSGLLMTGSCTLCAEAAGSAEQPENPELAALLAEPLPEVDPDEDYIVRYSDLTVGSSADEGDHWDRLDGDTLEEALESGTVVYYEEDAAVTLLDDPTDQWEHSMIGLEAMEQVDADGTGVVIGIIDSGIYPHKELSDCLLTGYNYIDENENTTDTYGHGTKVAGVIAAACDGNGVSGIAPGAKLVPLKAFDARETSISNLISAIYGAADTFHVDILNMSFGTTSSSEALEYAINYAASQGIIMTAAAGNDGTAKLQYPAAYENVIGVGSITSDGSHASSSQCNDSVYISAPGVLVNTTTLDNGYSTASGTSFATPMVTGAIADLLSLKPELTVEEIRTLLAASATDAGSEGYDTSYGWGILNLKSARELLLGSASLYVKPLGVTDDGSLTTSIIRLSGDFADITLVITVTAEDGTLTAASTRELTLDASGALTDTCSIPSEVSAASLLPENLDAVSCRKLTLENGSTVCCYVIQTGTRFRDVSSDQYYFSAVIWAAENSITYGTGGIQFSPDVTCTRAQIVTLLWRAAGSPNPESTADFFVDVPSGSYYETAVRWAAENGIIVGTDALHFSPDAPCTRAQIVTILWRAAGSPAPEGTVNAFTDVSASRYYYAATLWGTENGIVRGLSSTTFAPDSACTRAHAVTFLYRLQNLSSSDHND